MRQILPVLLTLLPLTAFGQYEPTKYSTVKEAIEAQHDYATDANTFEVVSQKPLHIRLSPRISHADYNDIVKEMTRKAILYGVYRTFIHTNAGSVKVTAVPIDIESDKFYEGFKETVFVTRDRALKAAVNTLDVKSFDDLMKEEVLLGEKFPDFWSEAFERGYSRNNKPGLDAFYAAVTQK